MRTQQRTSIIKSNNYKIKQCEKAPIRNILVNIYTEERLNEIQIAQKMRQSSVFREGFQARDVQRENEVM